MQPNAEMQRATQNRLNATEDQTASTTPNETQSSRVRGNLCPLGRDLLTSHAGVHRPADSGPHLARNCPNTDGVWIRAVCFLLIVLLQLRPKHKKGGTGPDPKQSSPRSHEQPIELGHEQ